LRRVLDYSRDSLRPSTSNLWSSHSLPPFSPSSPFSSSTTGSLSRLRACTTVQGAYGVLPSHPVLPDLFPLFPQTTSTNFDLPLPAQPSFTQSPLLSPTTSTCPASPAPPCPSSPSIIVLDRLPIELLLRVFSPPVRFLFPFAEPSRGGDLLPSRPSRGEPWH
jgi:hypothetical protein